MENIGRKPKTIKLILKKKIDEWIKTIKDEELQGLVKRDVIVTGGSIASMILGEKINDYDIYFKTYETTLKVANYYVDRFKETRKNKKDIVDIKVLETKDIRNENIIKIVIQSSGIESENREKDYEYFETRPVNEAEDYVNDVYDNENNTLANVEDVVNKQEYMRNNVRKTEKKEYKPVFLSSNAITLSDDIQIVLRFFGSTDEIHENYDFVHCTNYFEYKNYYLHLRKNALQCLLSKSLVYQGSRYPLCSLFRLRKFISRGWRINAGQIFKIAKQVSDLDLNDYNVLEDQLTGVDVAYFQEVLDICKDKTDGNGKIESAYLIEIINRMFGE